MESTKYLKFLQQQVWSNIGEQNTDWTINGQAQRVFTSSVGLDNFSFDIYSHYMRILGVIFDPKIKPNIVSNRILFKCTNRQFINIFNCSSKRVKPIVDMLISSGTLSLKFKSTIKGVASEYYIHCPATVLIKKLGLEEEKSKNIIVKENIEDAW